MKKIVLSALIAAAFAAPMLAKAESTFVDPSAANVEATAKLNFSIVIPQVLFLSVGTSANNTASDGAVDNLKFVVPGTQVGNGTAIAGIGGDLGAGVVSVRVYGNGGDIALTSTTTGALTNVNGDTISWSEIFVNSAALATATSGFTNAAITHPAFNTTVIGGGVSTPVALTAINNVVRVEGQWAFSYLNTTAVAAGTYGGAPAKNGVITYTATQL
jgi:hypothetical protein